MLLDYHLETFIAVCEYMNYTKAAQHLHITQPAVSQHIQFLENQYNCKLFLHDGKKIQISPAGQLLLQTAITLKNDEQLVSEIMRSQNPHDTPLIFGTTMTIGEYVIANPLSKYIKDHPDVHMKMFNENTSSLLRKLQDGEINFALVEGYFPINEYDVRLYSKEKFIAICSANHPFSKKKISLRDLLSERLLIREPGSGSREILEKNLLLHNINILDFKQITELGSMHTIIQLVQNNCGISFLYKQAVLKELEEGSLVELSLSDFSIQHEFNFIWNKNSLFSDTYEKIFNEFKNN